MLAVPLFLALVLGTAAAHKAMDRDRMASSASQLLGVPPALGAPLGTLAAGLEAIAALALILPETRILGAGIAAALWMTYAVALLRRRGDTLDCGCDFGSTPKPVGLFEAGRAAGLALLGVLVALIPSPPFTPEAPFAALAFFALYGAATMLASNRFTSRRIAA